MESQLILRIIPNFHSPISISIIILAILRILNRRLLPRSEAAAKALHLFKLVLITVCLEVISNSVSILLTLNSCVI